MKPYIIAALFAGAAILSACDSGPFASADAIRNRASLSLEQKNFSEAAKDAEALIKKTPDGYDGYYLLAQARAQLGDKNAAIAALESAIKKGYKDDTAISANANLQPLQAMSAFRELMDSAFPKREKAVTAAGDVAVGETDSKTVIRAGDVVVELPKEK
jgi:tetratricopeptide (TPR) repeat protein